MMRRLAAFLMCALIAFGQRSRTTTPVPPKPTVRYLDFVAEDAAGRPVADLGPGDLELVQAGESREITQLTWFDTLRHTARGESGLNLKPDDIHRNFIAIVDDLGLPADGMAAVQASLRGVVKDQMAPGERMAVLRTSSGTGILQQLTDDKRILTRAIDAISFLGGGTQPAIASGANWLTLRHALQGLQQLPGRKFVVLFSPNLRTAGGRDLAAAALSGEANTAMATVYGVDQRGPGSATAAPSPLENLVRETGGIIATDLARVFQAEQGFYSLAFEEPAGELTPPKTLGDPVEVKARRAGVTIRARSGTVAVQAHDDFPAPVERGIQIRRALASPFEGADIHARMTAGFAGFTGQNAAVEATILIDGHDLGIIRDAKGLNSGSVRVMVAARSDAGTEALPIERSYDLALTADTYENALRNGLVYAVALRLPRPGAWRIRAVVADGVTDRLGTAVECVTVPERQEISLSGVKLSVFDPGGGAKAALDPGENEAARIFQKGRTLQLTYTVFNPLADDKKQAHIEVRTIVYARGHAVFVGTPSPVTYPVEQGVHRQVSVRLSLASTMAAGDYVLEVTVVDKSAAPAAPRIASSFIDFHLRD
jgi:VWFA-related protein